MKRACTEAKGTQTTSEAVTEVQEKSKVVHFTFTHPATKNPVSIVTPVGASPIKKCKIDLLQEPEPPHHSKMVDVEENIKLFDVGKAMYQTQVMSLCNFVWAIVSLLSC